MPFLPVGGQAVIEGVMMRSPSKIAVAVRRSDGSLATMERPFVSLTLEPLPSKLLLRWTVSPAIGLVLGSVEEPLSR